MLLKEPSTQNQLNPDRNVNLGSNLKWKPGDKYDDIFSTTKILRGRTATQPE
ncbi:MAG: hypothetical protein SXA11_12875 [Cyanobacteriota bacterium]|nr:hypothetical protein [Cyanobacteriota bacterium]